MGFEEVSRTFQSIANILSGTKPGVSSMIAWIGIILIAIVIIYYLTVGFTRAIKAFLNMKVRYVGIFTLLLGVLLIVLAIVLP